MKAGPNGSVIFEPADIHASPEPDAFRDPVVRDAVRRTFDWDMAFLTHPDPLQGRAGPVCPFTAESVGKGLFWFSVHRGIPTIQEVVETMVGYRDWFLHTDPTSGRDAWFKTLHVIYPDLDAHGARAILDPAHPLLRPLFTPKGLVVGPFHAASDVPGMWNPAFRPLRSPVPFMVFRHMVLTDMPLVRDSQIDLTEYLRRYSEVPIAGISPAAG
jgi:hypothetical protein